MATREEARIAVLLEEVGKTVGGFGRITKAVTKLDKELDDLRSAGAINTASFDSAKKKLREVEAAAKKAGGSLSRMKKVVGGLTASFGKFRTALFDAFLIKSLVAGFVRSISRATQAVFGLFKGAQDAAIELTGIEITLMAATSSIKDFVTANLKASEIARKYGVDLLTTTRGLADFLASTKQSEIVFERQLAIFESLVRVGRVLNLSNERIKLSILALSQIASKGALQMEELKRQLESIPGAVPALAKELGITVPELFDKVKAGAVGSKEALIGLQGVFDTISAEQAVQSMQTLAAELGRLQTEASLIQVAFGDATSSAFRDAAEATVQLAKDSQLLATRLGELASEGILPATTGFIKFVADAIAISNAVREIGVDTGFLGDRLKALGGDLTPFGVVLSELGLNAGILSDRFKLVGGDVEILGVSVSGVLSGITKELGEVADAARGITLDAFIKELEDLEKAILSGEQNLTLAFRTGEEGRKRAAEQVVIIGKAVLSGIRDETTARRLLNEIRTTASQEEQIAAEKALIAFEREQRELEKSIQAIEKRAEAAKAAAVDEKALAAERLKLINDAVQASGELASTRIAESKRTRGQITAEEQALLDDRIAIFQSVTSELELSAATRKKIEGDLTAELLDIEQKFQDKKADLIRKATEKLEGADVEKQKEIAEKLTQDLIKEDIKRGESVDKLIKKRIDGAKTAADKEIKEAERSTKKQQELLEGLAARREELLRKSAAGEFSTGQPPAQDPGAGLAIVEDVSAEVAAELAALEERVLDSGGAFKKLGAAAQSNIGLIATQLQDLKDRGGAQAFELAELMGDLGRAFGASGEAAGTSAEKILSQTAALQRAKVEAAGFGDSLDEAGASAGMFVKDEPGFGLAIRNVGEGATEAAGGVKILRDEVAGIKITNVDSLADGVERVGAAVEMFVKDEAGFGIGLRNVSDGAAEAAGGVKVLRDEVDGIKITNISELAEGIGDVADDATPAAEGISEIGTAAAENQEAVADTATSFDLMAKSLPPMKDAAAGLAESIPVILSALSEAKSDESLADAAVQVQAIADATKGQAADFDAFVSFLEALLKTGEEKTKIDDLAKSLADLAKEEVVARMGTLGTNLGAVATALGNVKTNADGVKTAVDDAVTALTTMQEFLTATFLTALADLAADLQTVVDRLGAMLTKLGEVEDAMESIINKNNEMTQIITANTNTNIADLVRLLDKLREVDTKQDTVLT